MNSITLSELTGRIQETIRFNFDSPVWIRAEISELRENNNGHCYLELFEKDTDTDSLLAKCKGTIWSSTYRMLKPYFESSTGQQLRAGLSVLVAVTVEFHGVYGFSLNIKDIDPTFTIGELAARRLKIIRQLEDDGIADMNKQIPMPERPQRIAIISSGTAAGYGDFMDQLASDPSRFAFYTHLFTAIMQGDQAEASIIAALERIYEHSDLFDVVVIIRGGGATSDLACFDSYDLALNCAQFPLPIIAGIGHQRDVSILDMVANTSVKTPTAAAEFMIGRMMEAQRKTEAIASEIYFLTKSLVSEKSQQLDNINWKIRHALKNKVSHKQLQTERLKQRLTTSVKLIFSYQKNRLDMIGKSIETHSPAFLLKHGYSITTVGGKRVTATTMVAKGDLVRTYLFDGDFESTVL